MTEDKQHRNICKNLNFPDRRWKASRRFGADSAASRATGRFAGSKSIMEWWKVSSERWKSTRNAIKGAESNLSSLLPCDINLFMGFYVHLKFDFCLFISREFLDVCELTADTAPGRSCSDASGFATKLFVSSDPLAGALRVGVARSIEMSFGTEKKFMKIKFNFDTIFAFECKAV